MPTKECQPHQMFGYTIFALKMVYTKMRTCLIFLSCLCLAFIAEAQPDNDNCTNAILLDDVGNWCSEEGAFTNVDATDSGYDGASCWADSETDVWFVFTAFATDVVITVIGDAFGSSGGTLMLPQVALYRGICGGTINQLACGRDERLGDIIEINRAGLTVGEEYFIRVDGGFEMNGTFQLCVNNFNPPVEPGQDCITGSVLCDKSPFGIELIEGAGNDPDEAGNSCLGFAGVNSEQQSTWYRWTAANNGSLSFTITPNNPSDDLDFVLYRLPTSIDMCSDKEVVRCMATACPGATGLNDSSTDTEEDLNCDEGEDGFVRSLMMEEGMSYALVINNFSSTGNGYSIVFGGDGEFLGPEAQFRIEPESGLRCEEEFMVFDESSFDRGTILSWEWNFGESATPQTATGPGPHAVTYRSIGTKFITLTIETDLGCIVTDVRQLVAEPCCEDLEALSIDIAEQINNPCPDVEVGEIVVGAVGGTPDYQYSLDGDRFREIVRYTDLATGEYELRAIDARGCRDSIIIEITAPDPIIVDLGPDQLVSLGDVTTISADFSPMRDYNIQWCPPDGIVDTLATTTEVQAPGETLYILKLTDDAGCLGQDSVRIRVSDERPVYLPNAFSPNGDGINDEFTVYANPSVDVIESLQIFDRWGNMVYFAQDIPANQPALGWDGRFKGQVMPPAVFTAVAKIRFIDDVIQTFGGDLTLIR